jgi:aryl-alcohol dehydrogenase-like predicted oxidoreductase
MVSERSFGAWAIGGASYGAVDASVALSALAQAEELGCNFVDTAAVYGNSEALLGQFLPSRRERWIVASKYSGQAQGMTSLVEEQLRRMRTDRIDFYQVHWAPHGEDEHLYHELETLKRDGKIRFCGASLRSAADIDHMLGHTCIDGFQVCVSLLDPDPLVSRLGLLRARGPAIIARSVLKGGFLTDKYGETATFTDLADQRREWSRERIRDTARRANAFRFLADAIGTLHAAAIAYPLSFKEVSTVVLSCKSVEQAHANFGDGVPASLNAELLERIERTQRALGVFPAGRVTRMWRRIRRSLKARDW